MLDGMNTLSTKASSLVNRAGSLLFPPTCLFCHAPIPSGNGCCAACLAEISIWPHHICQRCGVEMPASMAPGPCGHCLKKPPAQQQTHSLYRYHGPIREAILNWKLQGHEAAVRWMVEQALPGLREQLDSNCLLLPVPMPLSRMRKSGQHHAANLCRWIAEGTGCLWDWRILRRIGEQPRQSALSGQARRKNLRKAFAIADDYRLCWQDLAPDLEHQIKSVWIVDDILTTGSTLHYAARACLKLGKPVNVLSLARTSLKG